MTRKRFVKLMMSRGLSRNQAVSMAKESKMPYSSFYLIKTFPDTLICFGMAVEATIDLFTMFFNAMSDAMKSKLLDNDSDQ